jgi:branched-subunit amino acid aminotransferase/4-amino-4-deoxychorismate lyase
LPGITRKHILRLCAENNIPAVQQMITIHDVLSAREIFLTNAIMGVMPVTYVERHAVADQKPGPLTLRLGALYNAFIQEQSHGQAH